jgi:glutamine synthetase
MLREALVFVGTCDIAGHVLGKGFPARAIEARRQKGVGWTHSNLMQTAFGPIFGTPFGTAGDLMIVLRPRCGLTSQTVPCRSISSLAIFVISTALPGECCPRAFLWRAVSSLEAAGG